MKKATPTRKSVKRIAPQRKLAESYTHEVRFVERKNGKINNVEIFKLEEFVEKLLELQEQTMNKPVLQRLRFANYAKQVSVETRHKMKMWFFDRLRRNHNRK